MIYVHLDEIDEKRKNAYILISVLHKKITISHALMF